MAPPGSPGADPDEPGGAATDGTAGAAGAAGSGGAATDGGAHRRPILGKFLVLGVKRGAPNQMHVPPRQWRGKAQAIPQPPQLSLLSWVFTHSPEQ